MLTQVLFRFGIVIGFTTNTKTIESVRFLDMVLNQSSVWFLTVLPARPARGPRRQRGDRYPASPERYGIFSGQYSRIGRC